VFPNLIPVATRRKQVSSFLKPSAILAVAHHFGPHFIILPDAVKHSKFKEVRDYDKNDINDKRYDRLEQSDTFGRLCRFVDPHELVTAASWYRI
jgi:hypothetical protein